MAEFSPRKCGVCPGCKGEVSDPICWNPHFGRCSECKCYDGVHMVSCSRGERAKIVRWLRSDGHDEFRGSALHWELAGRIERGEHE